MIVGANRASGQGSGCCDQTAQFFNQDFPPGEVGDARSPHQEVNSKSCQPSTGRLSFLTEGDAVRSCDAAFCAWIGFWDRVGSGAGGGYCRRTGGGAGGGAI